MGIARIPDEKNGIPYGRSGEFRQLLAEKRKASSPQEMAVSVVADESPRLLKEESFHDRPVGLDWEEALQLCHTYRDMYEDRYFLTYCVFYEKNWQEIFYPGDGHGHDYGYGHHYPGDHYGYPPYVESEIHTIYGLRVYGLGNTEALAEKVISSSKDFLNGRYPLYFATEKDAFLRCNRALLALQSERFRYHRTKCVVRRDDDRGDQDPYYYEVRSQNPFIRERNSRGGESS